MLTPQTLPKFLERIDDAVDAQPIALDVISPTQINLSLNVQDRARGYDWIGIRFECYSVNDAALITHEMLAMLDYSQGITLLYKEGQWGLAVGKYLSLSHLIDASFYIICEDIKIKEITAQL